MDEVTFYNAFFECSLLLFGVAGSATLIMNVTINVITHIINRTHRQDKNLFKLIYLQKCSHVKFPNLIQLFHLYRMRTIKIKSFWIKFVWLLAWFRQVIFLIKEKREYSTEVLNDTLLKSRGMSTYFINADKRCVISQLLLFCLDTNAFDSDELVCYTAQLSIMENGTGTWY